MCVKNYFINSFTLLYDVFQTHPCFCLPPSQLSLSFPPNFEMTLFFLQFLLLNFSWNCSLFWCVVCVPKVTVSKTLSLSLSIAKKVFQLVAGWHTHLPIHCGFVWLKLLHTLCMLPHNCDFICVSVMLSLKTIPWCYRPPWPFQSFQPSSRKLLGPRYEISMFDLHMNTGKFVFLSLHWTVRGFCINFRLL